MNFWEIIGLVSTAQWLIIALIWLLGVILTAGALVIFVFKKERYLFNNLKRPIVLLEPLDASAKNLRGADLDEIGKMLKDNGFLNLDTDTTSYRDFSPHDNHCLVVLGYHDDMQGLDDIMTKVRELDIPLIVYTYGESRVENSQLSAYPWTNYANSKTALLNSIFATLGSWPYFNRRKGK